MKVLIGTKIAMTRIFKDDGTAVPVTMIQTGSCVVTQVKQPHTVQVGFGTAHRLSKSMQGHLKGLPEVSVLRDFIMDESQPLGRGDMWDATIFSPGEKVTITGTSKGRGFQGVVKRHGFHGSPASHGHKDQLRMPGSIGSKRQGPVQKGKRMAGHMGVDQITVHNIEVVSVDAEKNIVYLKGAIPGARGGVVEIKGPGIFEAKKQDVPAPVSVPQEEVPTTVQEQEPIVATDSTTENA